MSTPDLCEALLWDTEFFGLRIARIQATHLSEGEWEAIEKWCQERAVQCLYFLCDSRCSRSIDQAMQSGFRLVDIRIAFGTNLSGLVSLAERTNNFTIRAASTEDLPRLAYLARLSHTDSRFFCDRHFPRVKCEALYETWIRRSFQGWAQKMFVADVEGRPEGYITCHTQANEQGNIGLFGVSPARQGAGIGSVLVETALQWFRQQRISTVSVVTQGRNAKAQRLYQRAGFLSSSLDIWFHRWFER